MNVENCSNCGGVIGKSEPAYVYRENVVCQNCHKKLTNTEDKQGQSAIKKPIEVKAETVPPQIEQEKSKHKVTKRYFPTSVEVVFALVALIVVLLCLVNYTQKKNQIYPALSERDIKLIEAFTHEMNLLNEVMFSDKTIFEAQLAKLEAALSDLTDLGSHNASMSKMGMAAIDVSLNYQLFGSYCVNGSFDTEGCKKTLDDVSRSRENFVKAFQWLQSDKRF
jgi:hypothetical protein